MDTKQVAASLDGNQYGQEGSRELFARMRDTGIVAVFGASDDLMEFRGAIHEEVGAYEGTDAFVTKAGMLINDCENDACPHFEKLKLAASKITVQWCSEDDLSWSYSTTIPHETFEIMEDDEVYCRGIVFSLSDVPCPPARL